MVGAKRLVAPALDAAHGPELVAGPADTFRQPHQALVSARKVRYGDLGKMKSGL